MTRYVRPTSGYNPPYPNAGPYSADNWAERANINAPIGDDGTTSGYKYSRGVWPSYLNRLGVSYSGVAVSINTGAAEVNGHTVINDASASITADTPAANPRIDIVAVAYNNTNAPINTSPAAATYTFQTIDGTDSIQAYTAEIIILKGIEAAGPVAPTLEQDEARLFMIPLAQYQISVVPAISNFADSREFAGIEYINGVLAADNATTEDGLVIGTAVDSAATFGAAGLGTAIKAMLENSVGNLLIAGRIIFRWTNAVLATAQARIEFYLNTDNSQNLCGVIVAPNSVGAGGNGNARGDGAVDFQPYRAAATEVASGDNATIGGGLQNTASGNSSVVSGGIGNTSSDVGATVGGGSGNTASQDYTTIGGGSGNTSSAVYSAIAGGRQNTASGSGNSTVGGGNTNTASGGNATVGGGNTNTASGFDSTIPGGAEAIADKHGQVASAAGKISAQGDAQGTIQMVARATETHGSDTWRSLYLDPALVARMTIAASTAWTFHILVVGITQNAASQWGYEITGLIERDNANNTTLAASTTTAIFESDANFDAQVVADDANEALVVQVKDAGSSGAVVNWVATIRTAEVSFA